MRGIYNVVKRLQSVYRKQTFISILGKCALNFRGDLMCCQRKADALCEVVSNIVVYERVKDILHFTTSVIIIINCHIYLLASFIETDIMCCILSIYLLQTFRLVCSVLTSLHKNVNIAHYFTIYTQGHVSGDFTCYHGYTIPSLLKVTSTNT